MRASLHALGLALPAKRITVNLAPADVLKEGSHFDLPIALALLTVMGVLPDAEMARYVALGELALDGALTPVAGVLPAAIDALAHDRGLICPAACGGEAAWAGPGLDVLAPANLLALINHFKGSQVLTPPKPRVQEAEPLPLDLRDVKGNETAKRALEVAAAGSHNLLMVYPITLRARCQHNPSVPAPPLHPSHAVVLTNRYPTVGMLLSARVGMRRHCRRCDRGTTLCLDGVDEGMPLLALDPCCPWCAEVADLFIVGLGWMVGPIRLADALSVVSPGRV